MKNQISVEYLGTFGWILLVVMVTILALVEFGVLDLSAEFPEECYLGEQLDCKKHFLDENGNLILTIESKLNKEVEIQEILLEGYLIDVENGCSSRLLNPGEEVNIICEVTDPNGNPQLFVESRQKFGTTIIISPVDDNNTYELSGFILSDIVDEDISSAFNCVDLVSTGGLVEFSWQCSGAGSRILDSETYLGTGLCCEGTVVPNPCTDPVPNGAGGSCCTNAECNPFASNKPKGNLACQYYGGNTNLKCCSSCDDEDDPTYTT